MEMTWAETDLQPADYSFVVWADESPVDIRVTSHDGASETFPTYRMSDTVCVYDLADNKIRGSADCASTDGRDGGSTDDGSTPAPLVLPDIFVTASETLNHQFQFAEGNNYVTAVVDVIDEETFAQRVTVTQDGVDYIFNSEYRSDGSTFSATIQHEECFTERSLLADESWAGCVTQGFEDIYVQVLTSFDDADMDWNVASADVMASIYTNLKDTYYVTYIDYDNMMLVGAFW